jgi:hypothetical protein
MNAGKIILYIVAGIFIFFGVLVILGSFDPVNGNSSWIFGGIICLAIGLGSIWISSRLGPATIVKENVTLNLDLPGKVKLDTMKCQSCGGVLTSDNIALVNGAPMVTCPFCNTTYQLTEEPKW